MLPNLVRPLCRYWFHTLHACFRLYMFLMSVSICECHSLPSFSLNPGGILIYMPPSTSACGYANTNYNWLEFHTWVIISVIMSLVVVQLTTGGNASQKFTPCACCPSCAFCLAFYFHTLPVPIDLSPHCPYGVYDFLIGMTFQCPLLPFGITSTSIDWRN